MIIFVLIAKARGRLNKSFEIAILAIKMKKYIEKKSAQNNAPSFLLFLPAARGWAPRADLCDTVQVAQFCCQNLVDYYLLTFPLKYGIILVSKGEKQKPKSLYTARECGGGYSVDTLP